MEKYAIKHRWFPAYICDDSGKAREFKDIREALECLKKSCRFNDFHVIHTTKLCAWCGKVEAFGELAEPTSHGMCEECLEKQKEEMRKGE